MLRIPFVTHAGPSLRCATRNVSVLYEARTSMSSGKMARMARAGNRLGSDGWDLLAEPPSGLSVVIEVDQDGFPRQLQCRDAAVSRPGKYVGHDFFGLGVSANQISVEPQGQSPPGEVAHFHKMGEECFGLYWLKSALAARDSFLQDVKENASSALRLSGSPLTRGEQNVAARLHNARGFFQEFCDQSRIFIGVVCAIVHSRKASDAKTRRRGDHQADGIIRQGHLARAGFEEEEGPSSRAFSTAQTPRGRAASIERHASDAPGAAHSARCMRRSRS